MKALHHIAGFDAQTTTGGLGPTEVDMLSERGRLYFDRRAAVVAPLCGGAGPIAVRVFRPIVGGQPADHALDLLDPNMDAQEFNAHEVLLFERPHAARWCGSCLLLWDEREDSSAAELLARLPVLEWQGRGGSLLSPCAAESYFEGSKTRRRQAWPFLAWLYPALRRAEMRAKLPKGGAPFFSADRDHTSRDATCSEAENSALAVSQ